MTPFGIQTPDGENIYAWHVLPLPLYLQNEATLATQTPGYNNDFTLTESFRILKEDPESRVVLSCKLLLFETMVEKTGVLIATSSWRKAHRLATTIQRTNS